MPAGPVRCSFERACMFTPERRELRVPEGPLGWFEGASGPFVSCAILQLFRPAL